MKKGSRIGDRASRPLWRLVTMVTIMTAATTGCEDLLFDDPEHLYDGPPVVEFAPVLPAGNYARTITFTRTATADQTSTVRVNYISEAPSSPVTGTITRVGTSTAVQGTHYNITGNGTYTIAPGTNSVDIPIQILNAGFAPGQSVTLVLELTPGDGFGVSTKYKTFTFTLRRNAT